MSNNSHTTHLELGKPVNINKFEKKQFIYRIPESSRYKSKRLHGSQMNLKGYSAESSRKSRASQNAQHETKQTQSNTNVISSNTMLDKILLFVFYFIIGFFIVAICYWFIWVMMKVT